MGRFFCYACRQLGWQDIRVDTTVTRYKLAHDKIAYIPICTCGREATATCSTVSLANNPVRNVDPDEGKWDEDNISTEELEDDAKDEPEGGS